MTPRIQIDSREFQAAVKQALLSTSKELPKAITSRMFYLAVRLFAIMPPRNIQAAKQHIREYLNAPVGGTLARVSRGEKVAKKRQLNRVHLIIQARRKAKGLKLLYGYDMKKESGKFRRRAIGSVGYLKSGIVRALRQLNGHFSQFGKKATKRKPELPPNAALSAIASQYGSSGNVGIHKGSKGSGFPAKPGWNPTAHINLSMGIRDNQFARVSSRANNAMAKSIADEHAEIVGHLKEKMEEIMAKHNAVRK
jgi:hypothetical protein